MPLNINDSDISPDATEFPEPRDGVTEMTLSLLTCDVYATLLALSFSRPQLGSAPLPDSTVSVPEMETIIHDFQSMLPEKYLNYCTNGSPTAYVTANMCNLIYFKMQFMAFLPVAQSRSRESTPKETSDGMWIASIKTVEYRRNLEVESTKHWRWYWVEKQKYGAPEVLWAPMRKLIAIARRKRKLDLITATKEAAPTENANTTEAYRAFSIPVDTSSAINFSDNQGTYHWLQQPQNGPTSFETPWLLEDAALVDLGIDMRGIDGEMEWKGVNDWIKELQAEGNVIGNPKNTW
ncbi:hypothetical protein DL98DRAFT_588770 [Cadophora sp. DSE1049]|nr:hypothetical protein DL98DRAFT_588770 [Cadophora sp. DSE1049]